MRPPGKKSETTTKKVRLSEERATGKKGEVKVHLHVTILVNKLVKTQQCITCDDNLNLKFYITVTNRKKNPTFVLTK